MGVVECVFNVPLDDVIVVIFFEAVVCGFIQRAILFLSII